MAREAAEMVPEPAAGEQQDADTLAWLESLHKSFPEAGEELAQLEQQLSELMAAREMMANSPAQAQEHTSQAQNREDKHPNIRQSKIVPSQYPSHKGQGHRYDW